MIKFTEDYLIGIPEIDKEHKQLFVLLEQADEQVRNGADIRTTGMQLLNGLKDYAATHFAHEEAYMESIDDPELPRQRVAHKGFIDELDKIDLDAVDDNQEAYLSDLLEYLLRWLTHHILGMDKKIKDER